MNNVDEKKKKLLEKIGEKERSLNNGMLSAVSSLDVVFLLDTTGSMEPYIHEVQRNIVRVIDEVFNASPKVRMGFVAYKDHGDEGEDEFYLTKVLPLVSDRQKITRFVQSPDLYIGEGGTGPEAVECALHEAVNLAWNNTSPRAVVVIGDKPPHGVIDSFRACPKQREYTVEVEALKKKGTKIYSILCNNISETEGNFRWMSQQTGGRFFYLKEISDLAEILIGICLKETGRLPYYERKLLEQGAMSPARKTLLLELH
ncbi:MAG: VWA domain-containing protein [Nitrospirota bacterium]|nr:VWA domain-containing protein [Nitrospirota bacterium]